MGHLNTIYQEYDEQERYELCILNLFKQINELYIGLNYTIDDKIEYFVWNRSMLHKKNSSKAKLKRNYTTIQKKIKMSLGT